MNCPCGSGNSWQDCCGQYVEAGMLAPTPEALMRSRYSAYAQGNMDYLQATERGFKKRANRSQKQASTWLALKVTEVSEIINDQGFVRFEAYFRELRENYILSEYSRFQRIDGAWYYVEGEHTLKAVDLGRNATCFCASGKKYKRCCCLSL